MDQSEWAQGYEKRLHPSSQMLLRLLEATESNYANLIRCLSRPLRVDRLSGHEYLRVMKSLEKANDKWDGYFALDRLIPALDSTLTQIGYEGARLKTELHNLQDRSSKQSGRTFPIDPPSDIRVLVNLYEDGLRAYRFMFHEYGHVLHYLNTDTSLPYLLRTDYPAVLAEALAQVIEFVLFEDDWLAKYTMLNADQRWELRQTNTAFELLRFRRDCVFVAFENILYSAEPGVDEIERIASYLNRRFLLFDYEDGDSGWLARVGQLVDQPVSANQWPWTVLIREHVFGPFRSGTNIFTTKAFHSALERYYRPGRLYEWMELIKRASGEDLNPTYTVAYFSKVDEGVPWQQ